MDLKNNTCTALTREVWKEASAGFSKALIPMNLAKEIMLFDTNKEKCPSTFEVEGVQCYITPVNKIYFFNGEISTLEVLYA